MYELIYTMLAYVMGSAYWWVIGLALLLNRFIQKPLLILILISPFVWFENVFREENLYYLKDSLGNVKFVLLCLVAVVISILIYSALKSSYSLFKLRRRYVLITVSCVYLLLVGLFLFLKKQIFIGSEALFVANVVVVFFAGAFVMISFDCLEPNKNFLENLKRFFLLNTLSSTFLYYGGTQLGPNGTSPLTLSVRQRDQTKYLKRMGIRVALIMVTLKILSDVLGYTFLSSNNEVLSKLNFPTYQIMKMDFHSTIPRIFTDKKENINGSLHLAILVRAINWYFLRISIINFKIILLWMFGYYIKLGVDEPWKAKSFADFFRRTHVYVAHFYRALVYPLLRMFTQNIGNKLVRKNVTVWLMVFLGGMIYQTISHSYQLLRWSSADLVGSYKVRILYNSLLASFIVMGLMFEKNTKKKNLFYHSVCIIGYLLIYSTLMSISASNKTKGFSVEYLSKYLQGLFISF